MLTGTCLSWIKSNSFHRSIRLTYWSLYINTTVTDTSKTYGDCDWSEDVKFNGSRVWITDTSIWWKCLFMVISSTQSHTTHKDTLLLICFCQMYWLLIMLDTEFIWYPMSLCIMTEPLCSLFWQITINSSLDWTHVIVVLIQGGPRQTIPKLTKMIDTNDILVHTIMHNYL